MTTFAVADRVTGIDIELFGDGVGAVYLFDDDEPTLVDAGTAAAADRILDGLREAGVEPGALSNLVLSHVHTDHAGAAADLVAAAPDLDVFIHEMTAPHLVDPAGLVESSRQAMGEHFAAMGEQGPVPETNVTEVSDAGTTLDIGENSLELIYAPGHSPDHFAVWNPERRLLFAAECLGLYLGEADRWLPPATLPNFDVALVDEAIETLRGLDPHQIVFPHFGVWPAEPADAFELAERELHRFDERIVELHQETGSLEETQASVREELIDLGDAYDPRVEAFFARLITAGYLRHHDLD